MKDFDPIRAQRETITGLADVRKVVYVRMFYATRRLAEAEAEHNALCKIDRFVADLMVEAQEKLEDLEAQAETQAQMGSPP